MNEIESLKTKEKERREMEIQKERAESKKNKKKQNKDQYAMGKLRAQATKNSPYVIQIKQMEKSMKKL